jgi:hypothetical protein
MVLMHEMILKKCLNSQNNTPSGKAGKKDLEEIYLIEGSMTMTLDI